MMPRIGFVGMTHLGLLSAAAAAAKGFDTVAADPDESRVAALRRGDLPVSEPGLAELLATHGARLRFESDPAAIADCDLVYVAPDVPVQADGTSDPAPVDLLLAWARNAVKPSCILVVLSQVPPGFTRRRLAPGSALFYQVETLIFGRAVERALHPERFIVGCADPAAPLPPALAAFLAAFSCPILPMRFESAELAKISINLLLVAQLSITNTIAEICEGVGAVWNEIAPALRLDQRIGQHAYLGAGLGIGGGNLLRDVATARRLAAETGGDDAVLRGFETNSRHRRDWALRALSRALAGTLQPRVAILGLAYKQDTAETLNSPGLALAEALGDATLRLHDPVVDASAYSALGSAVGEPLAACEGCDAVAIMTPWSVYRALDPAVLAASMRGKILLDPYGMLDGAACAAAGLARHTLGSPAP
jgi:UDPglucose 6-dehydrogenase